MKNKKNKKSNKNLIQPIVITSMVLAVGTITLSQLNENKDEKYMNQYSFEKDSINSFNTTNTINSIILEALEGIAGKNREVTIDLTELVDFTITEILYPENNDTLLVLNENGQERLVKIVANNNGTVVITDYDESTFMIDIEVSNGIAIEHNPELVIPEDSKSVEVEIDNEFITINENDNTANYIDDEGYEGILDLVEILIDGVSEDILRSVKKNINEFENTIEVEIQGEKIILSKNGNVVTTLMRGSASHSKTVTNQTTDNYNEVINDNNVTTAYTGRLAQYISQGSASATKTGQIERSTTYNHGSSSNLPSTVMYNETINDNGVSTAYTGSLSVYSSSTNQISGTAGDTITISNHNSPNYNSNGYVGTLNPNYASYGSGLKTKTGYYTSGKKQGSYYQPPSFDDYYSYSESVYDNGITSSYTGTLTKSTTNPTRLELIKGSDTNFKSVEGQTTSSYYETVNNDNGVVTYYSSNSLTSYLVTLNKTIPDKINESSSYRDGSSTTTFPTTISYSDTEGYTGTLTKGSFLVKNGSTGSASATGTIGQYGTLISGASAKYGTYNYGAHCTGGVWNWKFEVESIQTAIPSLYKQIANGQAVNTVTYSQLYNKNYTTTRSDNGLTATWTGIGSTIKLTKVETSLTSLTSCSGVPVTGTFSYGGRTYNKSSRYQIDLYWTGSLTKPDTQTYRQYYKGTVNKSVTRYKGTVTKPDTRIYNYSQNYSGTVTKPNTYYSYVTHYYGVATRPETRVYQNVIVYRGNVTKPDTRVYRYQGTVTKPDTREYEYTQNYKGVYTPKTRKTEYHGDVTRAGSVIDKNIYEYILTATLLNRN